MGVIGLGQMGILHAAMSNSFEGNRVVAISDNDSFLLKLAKKVLPTVHHYSDYREMLRKEEIEALYICTPVQTHLPIAHDILTNFKGVNVFVEKPLAASYREASTLVEDSHASKAITMVGYQKRYEGVFQKAKQLLGEGILGEIGYFRSHFYGSNVLRDGSGWKFQENTGGVTLEYGVHLLDLLIWYFGDPISVKGIAKSLFSSRVEDFVSSYIEFPSGINGSLEMSWSMRNYSVPELLFEAHGKYGSLTVTEDRVVLNLDRVDGKASLSEGIHVFPSSSLDKPVPFLVANPENVLQEEDFLNCVKNGTQPQQNFESAARVNKFVDMLRSSYQRQ